MLPVFFFIFILPILNASEIIQVNSAHELETLLKRFDRNRDTKITQDDKISSKADFILNSKPPLKVTGLHQISNLSQELKYSELSEKPLRKEWVFENPVDRISRLIRDRYWEGLTRRIDPETIDKVITDSKIRSTKQYLYVPEEDIGAWSAYKKIKRPNLEVVKLPLFIPPGFINKLGNKQGLLSLAMKDGKGIPYVVPGGRFNEMYGWDSYFHSLGVIQDGRPNLAKSMVENFVYEIKHYGKILNANRTYYLTRSQPPFLTSMIRLVIDSMKVSDEWIKLATLAALVEYEQVWLGKERLTPTGLSRYAGFDEGIPPEVERGHFDHALEPFAKKYKVSVNELRKRFNEGKITDKDLVDYFHQDRAVRESGHDTTYRWRVNGKDKASDFVTVDLNSLLYRYELDLAWLLKKYFHGSHEKFSTYDFQNRASQRKNLIRKYFWNSDAKMFFDYNWKKKEQSRYISATTFYPLWASKGHDSEARILSHEEAIQFVKSALTKLEESGGLAATAEESLKQFGDPNFPRQWDHPYGWAPHQILAWEGLWDYGFQEDVERLIYKWLYMITKNASDYNGTIPEKFNVKTRSHKVFVEYGNVGTKFKYITLEGFGWMNASYQLGLNRLSADLKMNLKKLRPPEEALRN